VFYEFAVWVFYFCEIFCLGYLDVFPVSLDYDLRLKSSILRKIPKTLFQEGSVTSSMGFYSLIQPLKTPLKPISEPIFPKISPERKKRQKNPRKRQLKIAPKKV
jgi:hypothetical protein